MRTLGRVPGTLAAAGLLLWKQPPTQAQIPNAQPAPPADQLQSVTLVFGSKDMAPAKWDGAANISAGKIEKITGYHFTAESRIDGATWQCGTHPWAPFSGGMHPNEKPQPQPTPAEPIGVTLSFRAPADAELRI